MSSIQRHQLLNEEQQDLLVPSLLGNFSLNYTSQFEKAFGLTMGLLTVGSLLDWKNTKKNAQLLRNKGAEYFIKAHNTWLSTPETSLVKWGDEVEYSIIKFDHKAKRCYVLLKNEKLFPILSAPEKRGEENLPSLWRYETCRYMIEATPGSPWNFDLTNFKDAEKNMQLRRNEVQSLLGPNEHVITMTAFPHLGRPNYTYPSYKPKPSTSFSGSLFAVDEAQTQHARFNSFVKNTRERRGRKVIINVPIFVDKNTPRPFIEDLSQYGDDNCDVMRESKQAAKPDHIYLDSLTLGFGCTCLQETFQCKDLTEAKYLYDQMAVLGPIFIALSACSPVWRGYLSDVDCRWNILSASTDDRTREELGEAPLKEGQQLFDRSRMTSINCYISDEYQKYNDTTLIINEETNKILIENGVDKILASHISNLLARDPLVVFEEKLTAEPDSEHFEQFNTTNWNTMRLKPPVKVGSTNIGWRVEFRPTELQFTDYQNASFLTFIMLLSRAILHFKLNLIIPISKMDENIQKSQKRDACLTEKLYFRTNVYDSSSSEGEFSNLTINEIINGNEIFPGLIQIVNDYLGTFQDVDLKTKQNIDQYLRLFKLRANGSLMTPAAWMRNFIMKHPEYKQDSIVSERINYDLMWNIFLMSSGKFDSDKLTPLEVLQTTKKN